MNYGYISQNMFWEVKPAKNNSDHFAEFVVKDGHNTIAFVQGSISDEDTSVLRLINIDSGEVGQGIGTNLLLELMLWGQSIGAEVVVGDFKPTGDREERELWYQKRNIFLVNDGYDIQGIIANVITGCRERMSVFD